MGSGNWSSQNYAAATSARKAAGDPDFGYHAKVKSGQASGVHPDLDPAKVAGPTSKYAGQPMRESRDSDEHPESLPVAILFDVTGSMGSIPVVLQTKLALLMDTLLEKSGVAHPQVLVGAIGDTRSDRYPLQIGQFESDNKFDEQLRNIILEGNGGGQKMESYALAYRFGAYHTSCDSIEKRGKKGYLFTMGDEGPWPTVTADEVKRLFNLDGAETETIEQLLEKAKEKWEVYHLRALGGSYDTDKEVGDRWSKLLGERFIPVDDPDHVCEVIAAIIHSQEAACNAQKTVSDLGLKGKAAVTVEKALVQITGTQQIGEQASGGLPATHPAAQ